MPERTSRQKGRTPSRLSFASVLPALAVLLLAGLLMPAGCSSDEDQPLPTVSARGRTWQVETATNNAQRMRGLMDREYLPPDRGMLFVFEHPRVLRFHMENCLIPLDVAFMDANRTVVRIHTMTVEPGLASGKKYSSDSPALYALEVNAGALAQAGVRVGDRFEFSPGIPAAH